MDATTIPTKVVCALNMVKDAFSMDATTIPKQVVCAVYMVQNAVSMDATKFPKKVVCAQNMVNNISTNHCKRPTRWHLLLHSFVAAWPFLRPHLHRHRNVHSPLPFFLPPLPFLFLTEKEAI
eukprot:scaffold3113_cov147-Skeletonema_menzelii.AAC.7